MCVFPAEKKIVVIKTILYDNQYLTTLQFMIYFEYQNILYKKYIKDRRLFMRDYHMDNNKKLKIGKRTARLAVIQG